MAAKRESIPRATISRLSVYLQELENFLRDGARIVSSEQLARACHVNATQIRKDLTYFGEFGVRGVGYDVQGLIRAVTCSLGIDQTWNTVIAGAGNLGRALVYHKEFGQRRFHIMGLFDSDPVRIGKRVGDLSVLSVSTLSAFVRDNQVQIGMIATPPKAAQAVAELLVNAGIKGILSYAPARLFVPDTVFVEYVDFFHHLYSLAFNISAREG